MSFPFCLGAYGRFSSQKEFDILIRAMREIQDVLVILKLGGMRSQEAELRELAQGLSNIEFVGAVKDVPAFLKSLDAVAVPSRWEPWGLTCLEAKAAGKPVLVSDRDGLKEQAQYCGMLVPVGDVEAWASAIALNNAFRKQLQQARADELARREEGYRSAIERFQQNSEQVATLGELKRDLQIAEAEPTNPRSR